MTLLEEYCKKIGVYYMCGTSAVLSVSVKCKGPERTEFLEEF